MKTFEVQTAFMMIGLRLEGNINLKICDTPIFDFPQQAFKFYLTFANNIRYIHYHTVSKSLRKPGIVKKMHLQKEALI